MPRASVWLIRLALLHLLAGFTLGALLLVAKGTGVPAGAMALLPVHIEFLLIGWMAQLAIGVAHWIFPRFGAGGTFRGPRREGAAWIALVALNLGVWAAAAGGLERTPWLLVAGRAAEVAAAASFALGTWARARASGLSAI
ncbi:MAG TPA: hypothetical protein VFK78_07260 [Gemmatimonadales bacterium]|nr:hypothetical protein [Gemmatimonadales bacterium]